MGKRQHRILRKDLLDKQNEFLGKRGHVILQDHVVHVGTIQALDADFLTLESFRSAHHHIPMPTVVEVVYDVETEY